MNPKHFHRLWLERYSVKSYKVVCGLLLGLLVAENVLAQSDFQLPNSRLKELNVSDLAGYRDLAEEISLVTDSTVARDLTVRLYLICAANSKGKLQRSALRGLIQSARDENESQRFKVLCYLTDSQFSNVFDPPREKSDSVEQPPASTKETNSPRQKLLDALLSIRQGKSLRAKRIMENKEVQAYFKNYSSIISLKEFNEACLMSELPNGVLLKVLRLDLKIRGETRFSERQTENVAESWRKLFKEKLPGRIPELSFATITEFDPSKTLFQNGVWRKPPK